MADDSHTSETSQPRGMPKPRRALRTFLWVAVICALGAAAYLLSQTNAKPSGSKAAKGKNGPAAAPGVPVSVGKVARGNIGEYIDALGQVTPVYTVTVTSRVAGELVEIHDKEGQIVKKGDLLAVIDLRPYTAPLWWHRPKGSCHAIKRF